jgi:hypothetical protein
VDQTERAKRANVRIAAYTFAAVLVFVCGHVGLISTIPLIAHCLSLQNPAWTHRAASLGAMTFLAYI